MSQCHKCHATSAQLQCSRCVWARADAAASRFFRVHRTMRADATALGPTAPSRRCKEARYCNRECQTAHWSAHRTVCRQIAEIKGFVPPSTSGAAGGAGAAADSAREDDLRVAWAIAAAAEVGRTGSSSGGGGEGGEGEESSAAAWSFSGLPPNLAMSQVALFKACAGLTAAEEGGGELQGAGGGVVVTDASAAPAPAPARDFSAEVSSLLALGCRADPPEAFGIPLHGAAAAGRADIVATLLQAGAAVNRASATGQTALHAAVMSGSAATVAALAAAGANFGIPAAHRQQAAGVGTEVAANGSGSSSNSSGDVGGQCLLHLAAVQDSSEDGGMMAAVVAGWTSWCAARASGGVASVDVGDEEGNTPLLYAALHANMGAINALLAAGATPGSAQQSAGGAGEGSSSGPASVIAATLDAAFSAASAAQAWGKKGDASRARAAQARADTFTRVLAALVAAGGTLSDAPSIEAEDVGGVALPAREAGRKGAQPALLLTPLSAVCTLPALASLVSILVDVAGSGGSGGGRACSPSAPNSDGSSPVGVAVVCGNVVAAKHLAAVAGASGDAAWLSACLQAAVSSGRLGGGEEAEEVRRFLGLPARA
jgi:hypothetical protein